MKKHAIITGLILVLLFGMNVCQANENVEVLLNKSLKVTFNGEMQEFKNVNGEKVYPISYDGTTYLPIRSISSLFKTAIKWDGETNSIWLGEGELDVTSSNKILEFISEPNENIEVLLNQEIKIYYNSNVQEFTDVAGKLVYPLSYKGTTYLPVRAVSNLFDLKIEWDGNHNIVSIFNDVENMKEKTAKNKQDKTIFETDNYSKFIKENNEYLYQEYKEYGYDKYNQFEEYAKYYYYTEYISDIEAEISDKVEELAEKLKERDINFNSYAQLIYMIVNNLTIEEAIEQKIFDYIVPADENNKSQIPNDVLLSFVGFSNESDKKYGDLLTNVKDVLNNYQVTIAAYEINKDLIATLELDESLKMYDNEEKLYITSNGMVFSMPGYALKIDKNLTRYQTGEKAEYYVGNISSDSEEYKYRTWKKTFDNSKFSYYTPIKNDDINHLMVYGYNFFNYSSRIFDKTQTITSVDEWKADGIYIKEDSMFDSEPTYCVVIKNSDENFDVFYIASDSEIYKYSNIPFKYDYYMNTEKAGIIKENNNGNLEIYLNINELYLEYNGPYFYADDYFIRVEDINTDEFDVDKFVKSYYEN